MFGRFRKFWFPREIPGLHLICVRMKLHCSTGTLYCIRRVRIMISDLFFYIRLGITTAHNTESGMYTAGRDRKNHFKKSYSVSGRILNTVSGRVLSIRPDIWDPAGYLSGYPVSFQIFVKNCGMRLDFRYIIRILSDIRSILDFHSQMRPQYLIITTNIDNSSDSLNQGVTAKNRHIFKTICRTY